MIIQNTKLINALTHLSNNFDDFEMYDSIDEIIVSAYNYVKKTGIKVKEFHDSKLLLLGLESDDGKFFFGQVIPIKCNPHHNLYSELKSKNISVVDFVNRQLMAFL